MADQLSATVIRQQVSAQTDRSDKRPAYPQRSSQLGKHGHPYQNAARAIIAKTYLYEKDYNNCLTYTGQIIS